MKIWCNNRDCRYIHLLDTPFLRTHNGRAKLLFDESYCGKCIGKPQINSIDFESSKIKLQYGVCIDSKIDEVRCSKASCLYNDAKHIISGNCLKDELFIDQVKLQGELVWICKCFSDKKIGGHRDWSRNLNPNGTAKGGHIDDSYSNKLNYDNKVTKSFSDHIRQFEEPRRKGK